MVSCGGTFVIGPCYYRFRLPLLIDLRVALEREHYSCCHVIGESNPAPEVKTLLEPVLAPFGLKVILHYLISAQEAHGFNFRPARASRRR